MITIPAGIQTFDFDCGVKALQLVMAYYGVEMREDELIGQLKSDRYGTSIKNMIDVAEKNGFEVVAKHNVSLETVKQYIEKDIPDISFFVSSICISLADSCRVEVVFLLSGSVHTIP